MKTILIYLGDHQEKKDVLESILQSCSYSYRFLQDEDLFQPIGWLLQADGYQPQKVTETLHIHSDLMFLDNIGDDEIQQLNAMMKQAGITMPRKVMRTKHNETWLLKDLLQEIEQEHAYFQTLEEIQAMLQASSALCIDAYTLDSWKRYEEAFYQAYDVLQAQSEPSIAKQALQQLKDARASLIKT